MIVVAAATLICYSPALTGGFVWDDDAHVTRPDLRSLDGLARIWVDPAATQQYYPLLHSFFWLQHRLWGDETLGYHLVNVLCHLTAALLLGLVLRRLRVPGAWLGAGIFALHPVAVESVAWISEQKNTVSTVLCLAAALCYLRFDEERERRYYAAASLLFIAALLAKTVAVSVPAALLVLSWWRRGRLTWKRDIVPLAPWFAAAVAAGVITVTVERDVLGAAGEEWALTLPQRALQAGRAVWFYLGKLIFPHNLTFIYPRFDIDPTQWWQYLYPAALLTLLIGLWALRGRSRAPLAVGLLYVGMLFPVLGFFDVYLFRYSFVADHFQYLPAIAVFSAAAASAAVITRKWHRWIATSLGTGLLVILGILTWRQAGDYRDAETLYRRTLQRNPGCWMASNNLGALLLEEGQASQAIELLEAALGERPADAETHTNLANALRAVGRNDEAMQHYREAMRLRPGLAVPKINLGNLLRSLSRPEEAAAVLEAAIRVDPSAADAYDNLGAALADLGRWDEAIQQYTKALALRPGSADTEGNLGIALARTGRLSAAADHFRAALAARPDDSVAARRLGYALLGLGQPREAVPAFEQALRLEPADAESVNGIGEAQAAMGNDAAAMEQFRKALELRPRYAAAEDNLGMALLRAGRPDEAMPHLDAALRVEPPSLGLLQSQATALFAAGSVEAAMERFRAAVAVAPDNADAHFNLALALARSGQHREALIEARATLRLDQQHVPAQHLVDSLEHGPGAR